MNINNCKIAQLSKLNFGDENGIFRYIRSLETQRESFIRDLYDSDAILLGDSVIEYTETGDRHPDSIAKILCQQLRTRLYSFSGGSFSYLLWNRIISKATEHSEFGHKIREALKGKLIIIPINLRSFSDEWYLRPSYQYSYIETILSDSIDINSFTFNYFSSHLKEMTELYYSGNLDKEFNPELYAQLDLIKQKSGGGESPIVRDVYNFFKSNREAYSTQYAFYYGYNLNTKRLEEFLKLDCLINGLESVTPLYYITPVNYQLMSDKTQERLDKNIALIKRSLDRMVFDYSHLVVKEHFYDKEHLRFDGRKSLANKLGVDMSSYLITGNTLLKCYRGTLFKQIEPPTFRKRAAIFESLNK